LQEKEKLRKKDNKVKVENQTIQSDIILYHFIIYIHFIFVYL
jgi:hypothetical protein